MVLMVYELFDKHYPKRNATVHVLNFGWIYAGIWSVIKAALPAEATNKLVFSNVNELKESFPRF